MAATLPEKLTTENMTRFILDQPVRWRNVIRSAGITVDALR